MFDGSCGFGSLVGRGWFEVIVFVILIRSFGFWWSLVWVEGGFFWSIGSFLGDLWL